MASQKMKSIFSKRFCQLATLAGSVNAVLTKRKRVLLFSTGLLLTLPTSALGQVWSGILTSSQAIDWSNVGVGGIPSRTAVCATVNASTYGNGSSDATTGIQNALNNCPNGQSVSLSAGTFRINSGINIPSDVTLRGQGADQTVLSGQGSGGAPVNLGTGSVSYSNQVNITNGNTIGSTTVVVNNSAGIAVGSYLVISEANDPNFVTVSGGEGSCTWCDGWSTNGTRARGQIVAVTSVSGTTIGISPGLYSAYTQSPTAVPFAMSASHAGVENLQVYGNNTGYDQAFSLSRCAYCWIKGVEVNYADGDFVQLAWGYRDEVRDSYFSNAFTHAPGSHDSDVFIVYKTSASLVENNIIERAHVSVLINWGAAGNVIGYNYTLGEFDAGATNFLIGGIGFHGAHPQFNLLEGNVVTQIYPDSVWGSSSRNTIFRNWVVGTSKACTPTSGRGTVNCTGSSGHYLYQAARAVQIAYESTSYNLVGNVVGSAQMQSLTNNSVTALTQTNSVAFPLVRSYDTLAYGYSWGYGESSDDGTGTGCSGGVAPCHNSNAFTTRFFHGEYNNVDRSLTWAPSITQSLPPSFYLGSKPAWFGSVPYPPIGPDVTGGIDVAGHANKIPAQVCYTSVMGGTDGGAGSPRSFNASRCYASLSGTSPSPPTGLTATVN